MNELDIKRIVSKIAENKNTNRDKNGSLTHIIDVLEWESFSSFDLKLVRNSKPKDEYKKELSIMLSKEPIPSWIPQKIKAIVLTNDKIPEFFEWHQNEPYTEEIDTLVVEMLRNE